MQSILLTYFIDHVLVWERIIKTKLKEFPTLSYVLKLRKFFRCNGEACSEDEFNFLVWVGKTSIQ